MLLHRSIHRPFPSPDLPNTSGCLSSDHTLTPRESPTIDSGSQTIRPALLANRTTMLSDHIHDPSQHFPSHPSVGPESSYTWPKSEPPATFGTASFGCRMELGYSTVQSPTNLENVEDQAKVEDKWGMGLNQQLPTPFSSVSPPFNNTSFGTDHELTSPIQSNSAIRSSICPTSSHQSQLPFWPDFAIGNVSEEIRNRARCNQPEKFAYDTAHPFGSSYCTNSSDLRTPTLPTLHLPFRGIERLEQLDSGSESEAKQGEPPYAKLIYRALMDSPDHQMVLKDIYEWIARNTDKARDPAFKGWQNSVRHNLSMNGAFRKVPHVDPSNKAKKGFIWVLEPSAVGAGIESTTRYRQKTVSKRGDSFDQADPKRQRSGRKGGKAARKSAKLRRSALLRHDARYAPYPKPELDMKFNALPDEPQRQANSHPTCDNTHGLPYYLTPPSSTTQPSFLENGIYDYGGMTETENSSTQSTGTVFDRQDQTLFGHPFDSGSNFMQHEDSGITKFEDDCLANRFTVLT